MRTILCCLVFVLAPASWLHAQVSVEIVLDQEQYLRDESLPVKVRISNLSGQTLHLGKEEDWVSFTVESLSGFLVPRTADPKLGAAFDLESSLTATKEVNLMPCYGLGRPGRYTVTASVKIPQWNQELITKPKTFEISNGTKVWEREFGVPATNAPPEVRKYTLIQANFLKQMRMYVRVTDAADAKVFRVIPIGQLLSFSHPEAQIDKTSRLHLLFQSGPRSFIYTIIAPDGELIARQIHDYTDTRPVLRSGPDGRFLIVGGVRRPTSYDLPAPVVTPSTNELKAPRL